MQFKRISDRHAEVRARQKAGDATNHVPDKPAICERVVEVTSLRGEQRALVFDRADDGVPRDDILLREIDVEAWEAGAMRHRLTDRDGLLTTPGEGGPVQGHRRVEIEPALLRK